MAFKEALESGKFTVTSEVGPLKGTDTSELLEVADCIKGKVDGANVTDQQSAVMRKSPSSSWTAYCHIEADFNDYNFLLLQISFARLFLCAFRCTRKNNS